MGGGWGMGSQIILLIFSSRSFAVHVGAFFEELTSKKVESECG